MSCEHDCERPLEFPKPIFNRPGLPAIDYRIGTYADMRAHMLARLDQALALARWTHRAADDPGIALIEGAAIVGDILSFYQQLYANEAFLRTARWRQSVADLVKLTGYRLAPGLAGHARFALAVKGEQPVVVPKGFGLKAQLEGTQKPAVFETSAQVTAYPHLNEFHLYRPRHAPAIANGADTFAINAGREAVSLKSGDRILVGILRAGGESLDHSQVLIVDKIWESFGTQFVKTKGAITALRSSRLPSWPILTALAESGGPLLAEAPAVAPAKTASLLTTSLKQISLKTLGGTASAHRAFCRRHYSRSARLHRSLPYSMPR